MQIKLIMRHHFMTRKKMKSTKTANAEKDEGKNFFHIQHVEMSMGSF